MSGQNRKITKVTKSSSSEKAKYTRPYFTYNQDLLPGTNRKELKVSPKASEVNKVWKFYKPVND